jgi:predicted Zn-dependent protease
VSASEPSGHSASEPSGHSASEPSGHSASKPQEAVERALAVARGETVVIADENSTANLRWAGNTLTTNGVSATRQLTVAAVVNGCVGVVSRSGVLDDQIEDLVRAAEQAAADGEPAEDAAQLAGPEHNGQFFAHWDLPPAATDISVLQGFASSLGETMRAAKASGRTLYGFAEHEMTSTFVGTSAGFRGRHDQPAGRLELNAKSPDMVRSAWAGVSTRDFTDVDVAGMDASLAERLDWAKRSVSLPAGRYETLLPPSAASDLLIFLYWSAGAKEAAEGRTVFSKAGGGTRVGERLSDLPVTLFSDPALPGLGCAPFVIAHTSSPDRSVFDNGLPITATSWISDGKLTALQSSRHSASLAGLPATQTADNVSFSLPGASASLADMIASTQRGLLLTCLWYIRPVDPQTLLLTGLTRDGVYLVENGEVTGAVNNFRFNESPVGMLGRLAEVGVAEGTLPREWSDYFTRAAMPPLRVEGFNMSSVSQAS